MPTKALFIFDIDGTLLETQRVTVPAVQRTFAVFGIPMPDAETIQSFFGVPNDRYEAWIAEQCPPGKAEEVIAQTNALELRLIGEEGRLYPGIRETLDALREDGHTLAICSNGPDPYVEAFLDAHGIRPYMTVVRTRGERYSGKHEMIGEILSLIPERPTVVVGDRGDDIAAARAHGAYAVAAGYGFGSKEELAGADVRVDTPETLLPALRRLLAGSARTT